MLGAVLRRFQWDAWLANAVALDGRRYERASGSNQDVFRRRISISAGRRAKPDTDSDPSPGTVNRVSEIHSDDDGADPSHLRCKFVSKCALHLRAARYDASSAQLCHRSRRRIAYPGLG